MNGIGLALIVAVAAAISAGMILALLPMLRRYAPAHPNARSSHAKATPQGGGIAVVAATIAVATGVSASGFGETAFSLASFWPVLAATAFLAAIGVADDVWTIGVVPRLLLQAIAVAAMLASLPSELRIAPILPWWFERALLLVACLWFVNLTNFMDGIDWMTVVEFVPIALGLTLISLLGALPAAEAVVALALCGGLLGFAPFNRPVARIFLGDVGSLPIGLLFAWELAFLAGQGHLVAALIMPLYYLADATLTLLRRIRNGEPFWQAHRTHFYQRAMDRGFAVLDIVSRVLMVNIVLVALAIATVLWPQPWIDALAFGAGCALVGCLLAQFARGKS